MKCSRMHLSDRRYKPPPRVSKCDVEPNPMERQCPQQRYNLSDCPPVYRSRASRSTSSQSSEHASSSPENSQKTPLIIVNLKIAPDAQIHGRRENLKKQKSSSAQSDRKLPPFCIHHQKQYHQAINKNGNGVSFSAIQEANMKVINDFIIQGTLIGNQRRQRGVSPDIIINCDENECEQCDTTVCDNVFNNINTDLLLSLDYYEMDSFSKRHMHDSTHPPTPIALNSSHRANSVSALSQANNRTPTPTRSTLLGVPQGFRPLSVIRTPSPNTRSIIRVNFVNRDKNLANIDKEIDYNLNRLREKRGVRNRSVEKIP